MRDVTSRDRVSDVMRFHGISNEVSSCEFLTFALVNLQSWTPLGCLSADGGSAVLLNWFVV